MYHSDVTGIFGNSVVSDLSQSSIFLVCLLRGTDSNANYEHSLHYGRDIVCVCVCVSGPAELDDKRGRFNIIHSEHHI